MAILGFDEINKLVVSKRSLPYAQYFGEMGITQKQKEERIRLANLFEEYFLYPMLLMLAIRNYGGNNWDTAKEAFKQAYLNAVNGYNNSASEDEYQYKYNGMYDIAPEILTTTMGKTNNIQNEKNQQTSDFIIEHAEKFADEIVETTKRHTDDPYFFSEDRIKVMSEEESNTVSNERDFRKAVQSGNTKKKWNAIIDNETRDAHRKINGKKIPIDDYFLVGGYLMSYPKDDSMGAPLNQIANCRCWLTYLR